MPLDKKIAILQSNYIPWKGYFDMIGMVDEFILYDDVQYTRNDWRNRNKIKTRDGVKWLTIPVRVDFSERQAIKDTLVSDPRWRRKHWESVRQSYARAACFREYCDRFEELYLGDDERLLSRINARFINAICDMLGIHTKISWSMDYRLTGDKSERLVDLCQQVGATEYLSGPAARAYIDERLFSESGIRLSWMDYSGYAEYRQLFPPFEHAVSIIDLILNEGPDAPRFMKSSASSSRLRCATDGAQLRPPGTVPDDVEKDGNSA